MKHASKTRILFVDDEPAILDMMQMMVQALEPAWETCGADSGSKALDLLKENDFDIIVSDMRMPGMSGVQLLNQVMRHHPQTSRIILSGCGEQDDIVRTLGAVHDFLSKPFALPAFQSALRRICAVREHVRSEKVQKLVGQSDLPAIPDAYFRVLRALENPSCSPDCVADALSTDPALTGKILELVNSPVFGASAQVSTAREATAMLGVSTIRSLAVSTHLLSAFEQATHQGSSADPVWRHSLRVAQLGKHIALLEKASESLAEQAFTAGLLHEVGSLFLAQNRSFGYTDLLARAAAGNKPLLQLEQEAFGATHADIGAYLLDRWGFPAAMVEAVAFQYEPNKAVEPGVSPLTFVHVAHALDAWAQTSQPNGPPKSLDSNYLDRLGLSSRLPAWQEAVLAN